MQLLCVECDPFNNYGGSSSDYGLLYSLIAAVGLIGVWFAVFFWLTPYLWDFDWIDFKDEASEEAALAETSEAAVTDSEEQLLRRLNLLIGGKSHTKGGEINLVILQ